MWRESQKCATLSQKAFIPGIVLNSLNSLSPAPTQGVNGYQPLGKAAPLLNDRSKQFLFPPNLQIYQHSHGAADGASCIFNTGPNPAEPLKRGDDSAPKSLNTMLRDCKSG